MPSRPARSFVHYALHPLKSHKQRSHVASIHPVPLQRTSCRHFSAAQKAWIKQEESTRHPHPREEETDAPPPAHPPASMKKPQQKLMGKLMATHTLLTHTITRRDTRVMVARHLDHVNTGKLHERSERSTIGRAPLLNTTQRAKSESTNLQLHMMSDADNKIALVRQRWDDAAVRYTETANKRLTLQCAREMHAHLALDKAQSVVEVAAGSGLGSLDIIERMTRVDAIETTTTKKKQQLVVTDLSPAMVELAKETLKNASSECLNVQVQEANGESISFVLQWLCSFQFCTEALFLS